MISPLYGLLIARTLFYDALFTKALSDRIPQIVFLGAGYDTRSYRYQDKIGKTTIYELDTAPTQKRKLEIVSKSKINIPRQIKYVPINFKTNNLENVLRSVGYDASIKTLFIWEGVTFYLTENDFKRTLKTIRSLAPQGSGICFDYLTEKRESGNPSEPYQFWIDSNELSKCISNFNIDIIEHVDSQEMEKRYLTLKNGTLAEKSSGQYCFVHGIFK
jgi:methyltransferase (TIGR00027 family)